MQAACEETQKKEKDQARGEARGRSPKHRRLQATVTARLYPSNVPKTFKMFVNVHVGCQTPKEVKPSL